MAGSTRSSFTRDLLITGVFAVAAIVGLSASGFTVSRGYVVPTEDAEAEIAEIRSRDIIDSTVVGEGDDALVTYAYRGEKVPEKLAEDEVVAKRTESSYTRLLGVENKGTAEEKLILETISYTRPTFTIRGDSWYYIEFDVTKNTYFIEATKVASTFPWLTRTVHAASISPFSTAGDGSIDYSNVEWSFTRDATVGTTASSTGASFRVSSECVTGKFDTTTINRGFVPFDTSAIPAGSTISAATLNLYLVNKTVTDNDGDDYLTITHSSQGTHTTLTATDYDQVGGTEGIDAGERKDVSSATAGGYLTFALNSTGRSWIKGTGQTSNCSATNGITCLGVREGHDASNSSISICNTAVIATISASEASGTSQDPYLSVTYTTGSFAFWQFQDF